MKKFIIAIAAFSVLTSCQKIEEIFTTSVESAKQKAQEKANEMVQETVNEQLNKYVNAQTVKFDSVFPHQNTLVVENEIGVRAHLVTRREQKGAGIKVKIRAIGGPRVPTQTDQDFGKARLFFGQRQIATL